MSKACPTSNFVKEVAFSNGYVTIGPLKVAGLPSEFVRLNVLIGILLNNPIGSLYNYSEG
jgi:hypothetical protein